MILLTFQNFDPFTHWVSPLRGRLHGSGVWRRMAALQLVGIEKLFAPVWRRSRQPFKPARGMPRKLASFHPHCAYACTTITAHSTPSN